MQKWRIKEWLTCYMKVQKTLWMKENRHRRGKLNKEEEW